MTVTSLPVLRPYLATLVGATRNLTRVFSRLHLLLTGQDTSRKLDSQRDSTEFRESDRNKLIPLSEISINYSGIRKETQFVVV